MEDELNNTTEQLNDTTELSNETINDTTELSNETIIVDPLFYETMQEHQEVLINRVEIVCLLLIYIAFVLSYYILRRKRVG
ncbi:hypothetical protein [Lysinibacillus xylanilyticus]|uniref:Uncharacterized protein n=1 Tax=Lysinibacillus xylanilyticus TaxID=582475 RepID=A0A2M9PXR2_9BACI|nr:hypothetical protein [Lysinibacillus xylanilyticus]PJO40624.1 hypothetical protein CWD94_27135 [Lysinibacillus xylanilyticus]